MKEGKEKTFYDLYEAERKKPTSAQMFVRRVARLTHRSESTVRMWIARQQFPDELAKSVIADEFGVSADNLFPKEQQKQPINIENNEKNEN